MAFDNVHHLIISLTIEKYPDKMKYPDRATTSLRNFPHFQRHNAMVTDMNKRLEKDKEWV